MGSVGKKHTLLRSCTADGSFANEQCSSKSHFQEGSPSNFNSCPVSDYESLVPDGEGFWSDPTRSTAEDDTGDILLLIYPSESNSQDSERSLHNVTHDFSVDESVTSDTDSSSSDSDTSSSETEATSSDDSDLEEPSETTETTPSASVKEFTEKEKLYHHRNDLRHRNDPQSPPK